MTTPARKPSEADRLRMQIAEYKGNLARTTRRDKRENLEFMIDHLETKLRKITERKK